MEDRRTRRTEVFNANLHLFANGGYRTPSGEWTAFNEGSGRLYSAPVRGGCPPRYSTRISVVRDDCIEVARRLVEEGLETAILNMASARNPGGGVERGSGAQEEQLCRRSDLLLSLYRFSPEHRRRYPELKIAAGEGRYPLHSRWGGIHSESVLFFRESEKDGYALSDEPFRAGVISVAAIAHPALDEKGRMTAEDASLTRDKIRTILRIGMENDYEAIVLGALGCGAFRNPPRQMARLFREVLEEPEFTGQFRRIVFAILEDGNSARNSAEGNYIPFKEEFDRKKAK